jgi:hypothetical protein
VAHGSHWHPTGSASTSPAAEDAAKVADVKADDIVTASVTATVARQTSQKNEKKAVGKEAAVVSPEPAVVAPPAKRARPSLKPTVAAKAAPKKVSQQTKDGKVLAVGDQISVQFAVRTGLYTSVHPCTTHLQYTIHFDDALGCTKTAVCVLTERARCPGERREQDVRRRGCEN